MKVTGNVTLTGIMDAAKDTKTGADKKLLSKDGQEVHTHAKFKMHRFGNDAAKERAEKAEKGLQVVKNAISNEFAHLGIENLGSKVIANLTAKGHDFSGGILVGDLAAVKAEVDRIAEMRTDINDANLAFPKGGYDMGLGAGPADGNLVLRLLDAAGDQSAPEEIREAAKKSLAGMLERASKEPSDAAQLLKKPGAPSGRKYLETAQIGQVFDLRDKDGAALVSNETMRNFALSALKQEASDIMGAGGDGKALFRGKTGASLCLSATLPRLDGGAITKVGKDIAAELKTQKSYDTAAYMMDQKIGAMALKGMPESADFLGKVANLVDSTFKHLNKDEDDPTKLRPGQMLGKDFCVNALVLRGVNPQIQSTIIDLKANPGQRKIALTAMQVLQQATAPGGGITANKALSAAFQESSAGLAALRDTLFD
ncbi:MAG: hypothetical protein AAF675_14470 [Pseudomonadota bacterium]